MGENSGIEQQIEAKETEMPGIEQFNEQKEAMKSCENFDDLLIKIELFLHEDPHEDLRFLQIGVRDILQNITYAYLKKAVRLKGEEAIFKITGNMNRTISQLDAYNSELKKSLSESKSAAAEAIRSFELEKEVGRRELEKWMDTLDKLKKVGEVEEESKEILSASSKAIDSFKYKLLESKMDLFPVSFFKFRDEIERNFGLFEVEPNFEFMYITLDYTK